MQRSSVVKLLRKRQIAKNTVAFSFTKPPEFRYTAGQFIELPLPQLPPHFFSLASAPYEEELMIATRYRETAFKKTLWNLDIGTEMLISAPFGKFTLHDDQTVPAVFLAGGIGIAPFYSMIKQALHEKKTHQVFLFHVNKSIDRSPFFYETLLLAQLHETFQVVPFPPLVTDLRKLQFRYHQNVKFYLCGSPQSVTFFKEQLAAANIDKSQIKGEDFPGYQDKVREK